jgi:hypothetical protein
LVDTLHSLSPFHEGNHFWASVCMCSCKVMLFCMHLFEFFHKCYWLAEFRWVLTFLTNYSFLNTLLWLQLICLFWDRRAPWKPPLWSLYNLKGWKEGKAGWTRIRAVMRTHAQPIRTLQTQPTKMLLSAWLIGTEI